MPIQSALELLEQYVFELEQELAEQLNITDALADKINDAEATIENIKAL